MIEKLILLYPLSRCGGGQFVWIEFTISYDLRFETGRAEKDSNHHLAYQFIVFRSGYWMFRINFDVQANLNQWVLDSKNCITIPS